MELPIFKVKVGHARMAPFDEDVSKLYEQPIDIFDVMKGHAADD